MPLHPETIKILNKQDYAWYKIQRRKPNVCIMMKVPKEGEPWYYFHFQQCKFHQSKMVQSPAGMSNG